MKFQFIYKSSMNYDRFLSLNLINHRFLFVCLIFFSFFFFQANGCIEFTGKLVLETEHIHQSDASKQEHEAKIEEYSVPSIHFSVFILIAF